jgi:hypothetical protein
VASLLTLSATGTALYLLDPYLNPRSLSTSAALFIIVHAIERRFWRAGIWAVCTAMIHPLMVVFAAFYVVCLLWVEQPSKASHPVRQSSAVRAGLLLPFGLLAPASDAYREAVLGKPYFFPLRWEWYEWVGIFAPLVLLWWFRRIGAQQNLGLLQRMSTALMVFGSACFAFGLAVTIPSRLFGMVKLQPMRGFHLLYVLFFIFLGGLLAEYLLKNHVWRWAALFVPLCAVMCYAQIQQLPDTPHVEWPGAAPHNDWVEAFRWIKQETPRDAYFVLDPRHMALPGEDQHGFRALAERSRLADDVKDRGVVTMFPELAELWRRQVHAEVGWKDFRSEDLRRLKRDFGVDWVVLRNPGMEGLTCPYLNKSVAVCKID